NNHSNNNNNNNNNNKDGKLPDTGGKNSSILLSFASMLTIAGTTLFRKNK
ncbi:LPXTG cell wall anchor domain-containing protein, partial [Clostridium tertium]